MARVVTAPELAKFRSDGQASLLYGIVLKPKVIFKALINQTFSTLDKVIQIQYDAVSVGAYTDIVPGMTAMIGTADGLDDLGRCRMRKAADATFIYIGEESEMKLQDDAFITVIQDFDAWAKTLVVDAGGTVFIDSDIAYSDQNTNWLPQPNAGSHMAVWLTGATINIHPDGSSSWVFGSSISAYLWTCVGASASSGTTTVTPTFTFNTPGTYLLTLKVTAANGKSQIGYRYVFVLDPASPPPSIVLNSCTGDYSRGGYDMNITMYGTDADISKVVDRAFFLLVARDFYGATEGSIGPIVDAENIIAMGRITEDDILLNPNSGNVTFKVQGYHIWSDYIAGFPVGLINTTLTPTVWTSVLGLTVDKMIYHLCAWRSTLSTITDILLTTDARVAGAFDAPMGSLKAQIKFYADAIKAIHYFDRYGRLFVEINSQYIDPGSRTGPTVMVLLKNDWQQKVDVIRNITAKTGRLELSGVALAGGAVATALFSLAAGHVPKHYGKIAQADRLLLSDQASSNNLAGLIIGNDNRLYDFHWILGANNRMFDIGPQQYGSVDIEPADNYRGITYNGKFVVRQVEFRHDPKTGFLECSIGAEMETFAENNVNGDIPASSSLPNLPPNFTFPILPPAPIITPGLIGVAPQNIILAIAGTPPRVVYTKNGGINWFSWSNNFPTNAAIVQFEISKLSGKAFINFDPRNQGVISSGPTKAHGLYTSIGLGQPWTLFYSCDQAFADNPAPGADNAEILCMGINRGAADEVMAISYAHFDGAASSQRCMSLKGSSTGLSPIAPLTNFMVLSGNMGVELFYGNQAFVTFGWDGRRYLFTRGGGVVSETVMAAGALLATADAVDGQRIMLWNATNVIDSPDFGTTLNAITPASAYPDYNAWLEVCACDPTGLYIMYCPHLSIAPQKSSDGGATWSAMGTPAVVVTAIWNLGDSMHWLAAGGLGVWYTSDFGAHWTDIRGDLDALLGIGWSAQAIRTF